MRVDGIKCREPVEKPSGALLKLNYSILALVLLRCSSQETVWEKNDSSSSGKSGNAAEY